MTNKITSVLLTLIALLLLNAQLNAPLTAKNEDVKIGLVNLDLVMESYNLTIEYEKKIMLEYEAKVKEWNELIKQIQTDEDELELFEKGSQVYQQKRKALQAKIFQASFFEKWEKQQLEDSLRDLTKTVYDNICKKVDEYGAKNGYTCILKVESNDVKSNSRTELMLKVNNRKVLFYKKSYDITNDIIKELNK